MKLNKKQVGLIVGVVCVILLTILLLSMCNGSTPEAPASTAQTTEASETTAPTTEAVEETTEAATEETIEETTEATEESTEPTTGGSTRPGGTGGPGIGGGGNTSTEPTVPLAGSEESPYMEVFSQFPDAVDTVSIPAQGTVHYYLSLLDASVALYGESLLVIEGENVSVIYNEKTYEAVNGIVSVPLVQEKAAEEPAPEEAASAAEGETEAAPEEETAEEPVSIRICNGGTEARTLTLKLDAPLGTVEHPEEMTRGENGALDFTAELEENDENGYYFGFVAERDGKLLLKPVADAQSGAFDIVVKAGEETATYSSDGDKDSLAMEFKKGDQILVQFLARAAEDASRPAVKANVTGYADYYGSRTNPIEVEKDFTTGEMEPGLVLYYLVKNQKSMSLNVQYPAYVVYNDKTYQAEAPAEGEEAPVISVKIGNGEEPVLMAIGNGGETAEAFAVTFTNPIGHENNKDTLIILDEEAGTDGINTAVIETGDENAYWFTWKNEKDTGILTIRMPEQGNWKYAVKHTSGTKVTDYELTYSDSEPAVSAVDIVVNYEDVVDIQVGTYDPADKEALPAGSVSLEASFRPHTLIASEGETFLTVEGGSLIYCKQGLKYADGAIMTVVAVEADEEGNAKLDENGNVIPLADSAYTIDYEGKVYTSSNGIIVVEGIEMDSNDPDIFSFRNDETEKVLYRISFSYPEGHMSNPIALELGSYSIDLLGDGKGIFYTYKIIQPTYFRFEITDGDAWTYNISTTKSLETFAETKMPTSTSAVTVVDVQVTQEDLDASETGYVLITINLGNPSTDIENCVNVTFELSLFDEYPQGSQKNPVAVTVGDVALDLFEASDGYYFCWTAPADGTFDFSIPSAHARKAWVYEITHGDAVYIGQKATERTQSFAVSKDDVVIIKFSQRTTIAQSVAMSYTIGFTESEPIIVSENPEQYLLTPDGAETVDETEPATDSESPAETEPIAETEPVLKTEPATETEPVTETESAAETEAAAETELSADTEVTTE